MRLPLAPASAPVELRLGALRVAPALALAPMEGVTDPCFRALAIETNGPGTIGAVTTEFLRVTDHVFSRERMRAEIGTHRWPQVALGVQLMGNHAPAVAASAARALEEGAHFVDLNFGCPAPTVFRHCAGSALLADPPRLAGLVRATVAACAGAPVTAKIRAGITEDSGLEDVARRIEDAGAAALTVHARLRVDSYATPAQWERIARARAAVAIPVIGNGGAGSPSEVARMFELTGCAAVMIGRGALADPWLFADWQAGLRGEDGCPHALTAHLDWIRRYAARMEEGGATPRQALGRAKQALKAAGEAGRLPREELTLALRAESLSQALAFFGGL